jgi:hypothetical protein
MDGLRVSLHYLLPLLRPLPQCTLPLVRVCVLYLARGRRTPRHFEWTTARASPFNPYPRAALHLNASRSLVRVCVMYRCAWPLLAINSTIWTVCAFLLLYLSPPPFTPMHFPTRSRVRYAPCAWSSPPSPFISNGRPVRATPLSLTPVPPFTSRPLHPNASRSLVRVCVMYRCAWPLLAINSTLCTVCAFLPLYLTPALHPNALSHSSACAICTVRVVFRLPRHSFRMDDLRVPPPLSHTPVPPFTPMHPAHSFACASCTVVRGRCSTSSPRSGRSTRFSPSSHPRPSPQCTLPLVRVCDMYRARGPRHSFRMDACACRPSLHPRPTVTVCMCRTSCPNADPRRRSWDELAGGEEPRL